MTPTAIKRFTEEELLLRRNYLGGSDATVLLSGDEDAIHNLWLLKTGQVPETDLSDVLAVQIGVWTEPFNQYWFERTTGRKVLDRNRFIRHPSRAFLACNLDGTTLTDAGQSAVWEAKWTNPFSDINATVQRYMGQLTHNMYCTGVNHAVLSVITGKPSFETFEVELDDFFLAQLVDREKAFWECVESFTAPPRMKPIAVPVPHAQWRTVDLTGSNEWAEHAGVWLETRDHAKRFDGAAKAIKALVEPDVGKASGYGVVCTRSKSGSLTIKAMEG